MNLFHLQKSLQMTLPNVLKNESRYDTPSQTLARDTMKNEAIELIRALDIGVTEKAEIFSMYLEDLEEYSEATALEKLENIIEETKESG